MFFFVSLQFLVFAFKQDKEKKSLQVQPLKMLKTKIVMLIIGLQAKFSEALPHKNRQLLKVIFWNWGPTVQQFGTSWQVPNFCSSKINPPYFFTRL